MDEPIESVVISLVDYKSQNESEAAPPPGRVHLDVNEAGKLSFQIQASGKDQIEMLMSATLMAHSRLFRDYMEAYGTPE